MIGAAQPERETREHLEDALGYLPRGSIVEYGRQQDIYDEEHPPTGLFLIIDGRVTVTTSRKIVTGIFRRDDFIGEMVMLAGHTTHRERATAIEKTALMSWSTEEVEHQVVCHPKLGLALMRILVGRCLDLEERLQSLALDKAPERVAHALIRFAKIGLRKHDGAVFIPPLTHQVLAEYIGTSREMVTFHMNELRRQGFLQYSRKTIQLYPEALTEHLRKSGALT